MQDVTLSLVPDPAHLSAPAPGADETSITRWVAQIRPLHRLAPSERRQAERAIDDVGHLLAAAVETGTIGDVPARWLLLAMINHADIAQSAAHSWLTNNRRGHGTGDVEELTDMVRDEFHKTVVGLDGDPNHAVWQWERVASTCGWVRKIAMRAAQQRKDKLGERNRVRLYGSSEEDRAAVYGPAAHIPVAMVADCTQYAGSHENPAGALKVRQKLEFQQVAARLVSRMIGVPEVPRIAGDFRVDAAHVLANSKASDVQQALRAVNAGRDRPEESEQALLYDLWAATTPAARAALLTVHDPRMCVAWAQGQVAARPRLSKKIIIQVADEFKPLKRTRRWIAMCNALTDAYAESVADLPNELIRNVFNAAAEKNDAQLQSDRRRLLNLAYDAIKMWDDDNCPMGYTPEQVEKTLRDSFNQVLDDVADDRARIIS